MEAKLSKLWLCAELHRILISEQVLGGAISGQLPVYLHHCIAAEMTTHYVHLV